MDFQYNVSRNYNRINFQNIFGMQFLPSALKEIYDAVVKRSYKDLDDVRHTPCYTSFLQRIQAKAR